MRRRAKRRVVLLLCVTFVVWITLDVVFVGNVDIDDLEYDDFFNETADSIEVEAYLRKMQLGTAYVRPIYEKETPFHENYWCFTHRPKIIEPPRKWTEMAGIFVFSAYFDSRQNSLFPNNDAVQVLTMSRHRIEGKLTFYCQIFEDSGSSLIPAKYAIVKAYVREIWQKGWDPRDTFYTPNLITCPIPKRLRKKTDLVVALSRKLCATTSRAIRVVAKPRFVRPRRQAVAVCVKGLDYQVPQKLDQLQVGIRTQQEDISMRLLEWIEANFLFGVDEITVYTYFVTNSTRKVLEFYQSQGRLTITPLTLPGDSPNDPKQRSNFIKKNRAQKRRHELIPYNDCLYRHIYTHRYVLIVDIDELVVPLEHDNYEKLLDDVEKREARRRLSSVSVRNVFKFPSNTSIYPTNNYMLSNRMRSRKISPRGEYGKSFSNTDWVATVFNHFALHRLARDVSSTVYLDKEQALKLHYKHECPWESRSECSALREDVVLDRSLDGFADRLRRRVQAASDALAAADDVYG